ncbi:MAG TPA: hypothetical protein DDZ65_09125 [Firmicutes bacterium]|nr:hypothetical protein [Bacillota bacterium]
MLCSFIVIIMLPITVSADMGPKPSVVVDFKGVNGESYYATLLSSVESTGPFSSIGSNGESMLSKDDEDYDVLLKFATYKDIDGYYFLQYFEECTETHQFSWTYYPPQRFKILLYFPQTDQFVVSDNIYERYAFSSYYTAEVSNASLIVEESYDYTNETLSLIARIILTIALEIGVALLFGFHEKRQLRFIFIVNLITQIALNFALNFIHYQLGSLMLFIFYFLMEIVIFMVEAIFYTIFLKKYSPKKVPGWKPVFYALIANAFSFALGIGLFAIIPGMF